jgi:hypothetical protein
MHGTINIKFIEPSFDPLKIFYLRRTTTTKISSPTTINVKNVEDVATPRLQQFSGRYSRLYAP